MPEIQPAAAAPFNPPLQIWACDDPSHRHVAKAEAVQCLEAKAVAEALRPGVTTVVDKIPEPDVDTKVMGVKEDSPVDPTQTAAEIEKLAAECAASARAVIDAALKAVENGGVALAKTEPDPPGDDSETAEDDAAKADKPKGDYGSVEYADPGYQDDKKPRYPVDTERHIRAAWSYINQEKNCAKYGDNCAKVKAKIVAAWEAKIDKDGPPVRQ